MTDCWLIWKKYFLKVALIFISTKKILLFIIRFTFKSLTWIPFKYLQISLCCFPVYTFVGDFVPHFHTSAEVSFNTGVTQKRSISRSSLFENISRYTSQDKIKSTKSKINTISHFSPKISWISENISNI